MFIILFQSNHSTTSVKCRCCYIIHITMPITTETKMREEIFLLSLTSRYILVLNSYYPVYLSLKMIILSKNCFFVLSKARNIHMLSNVSSHSCNKHFPQIESGKGIFKISSRHSTTIFQFMLNFSAVSENSFCFS